MISDYKDKKLVEYLESGQRILIRFGHGLGDTLMFYPIFERLVKQYPRVDFSLYVESGQEEFWTSVADKDDPSFDLIFHLDFPMSEGGDQSKQTKCLVEEIGRPDWAGQISEYQQLASFQFDSPLVAVHFQGTALPGSVSCPEETARCIWEEVRAAGNIPIEVHFEHMFHNPVNQRFPWVDCSVRGYKPTVLNLFGLLACCYAFVGVASGPFIAALSILPQDHIMYLQKHHRLSTYTACPVRTLDLLQPYPQGAVAEWLTNLAEKRDPGEPTL